MLTDTHIHLYSEDFDADRDSLIEAAIVKGVSRFLLPNIDVASLDRMTGLAERNKDRFVPMFGLHPCYVNENYKSQLGKIREAYKSYNGFVCAIGEIGLDFYWELKYKTQQEEAFREQVLWAHEEQLPISIHSRESTGEIISILNELKLPGLKGVFHCFSGDINQADEIINMGFALGIGGVVTFKNSSLSEIVRGVNLEHIVLETDGPYLAPTPYRGKRNLPEYLYLVAEKVAEIKGVSVEEVGNVTTGNAELLFNLEKE